MDWLELEHEIDALPGDLLADHTDPLIDTLWMAEDLTSSALWDKGDISTTLESAAPSLPHETSNQSLTGNTRATSSSSNFSITSEIAHNSIPAPPSENYGSAAEQKKRNAAASRKLREKRKAERDTLQLRVSAIEDENELLLRRIALLQNEVQSLRSGHGASLVKENALLKAEIKRHKVFMQRMVRAVQEHDSKKDESFLRIYYSSLRSTISRTLGLLHTSSQDPSWRRQEIPEMDLGDLGPSHIDSIYIQTLPLGVPKDRVMIANVRVDCCRIPMAASQLLLRMNALFTDPKTSSALLRYFKQVDQRERISEEFSSPGLDEVRRAVARDGHELNIFIYAEEGYEVLNYTSASKNEINLCATRPRHAHDKEEHVGEGVTNETPEIVEADMIMVSTISTMLAKAIITETPDSSDSKLSEEVQKYEKDSVDFQESVIVYTDKNSMPDECNLVYLGTLPVNPDLQIFTEFYLEDDGRACLSFRQMIVHYLSTFAMLPDLDLDGWKSALSALTD